MAKALGRWLTLLAMLLVAVTPVRADAAADAARLDALFARLAQASDEAAARTIENRIWTIWTSPSDPALARRMQELQMARMESPPAHLRDLLDDIVRDFPDYAEGWNQRATLAFVMGDYDASLADIDEVLKREPRHFGALAGQATIYNLQGRRGLAVETMRKALAIHPFLVERSLYPELDPRSNRA